MIFLINHEGHNIGVAVTTKKFEKGERVYFIQSAIYIKEAQVINDVGGFVTVRFLDSNGGFRARQSRFFKTESEAEAAIEKIKKK